MIEALKKLFGITSVDLAQLIKNGASIIDVRSKAEFAAGHAKGAVNIPLEQIGSNTEKLKKYSHIIVCCRSGGRSGMAQRTLNVKGFGNVTNGGSWQKVNKHI